MLTGIGLRNFKAFGDEMQEVPLSKITLIYGPNSGGKSSIIQALLLLKQSVDAQRLGTRRQVLPIGDYIDLGGIPTLIHKHDTELEIGLKIKYSESSAPDVERTVDMVFVAERSGMFDATKDSSVLLEVMYQISLSGNDIFKSESKYNYDDDGVAWESTFSISTERVSVEGELKSFTSDAENRGFLPELILSQAARERSTLLRSSDRSQAVLARRRLEARHKLDEARREEQKKIQRLQPKEESLRSLRRELRQADKDEQEQTRRVLEEFQKESELDPMTAQNLHRELQVAIKVTQESKQRLSQERRQILPLRNELRDARDRVHQREQELQHEEERARALMHALSRTREVVGGSFRRSSPQGWRGLEPDEILAMIPESIPSDFERQLRSVTSLGPMRIQPERFYAPQHSARYSAGLKGEFTPHIIYRNDDVKDEVNKWFSKFEIPYNLEIKQSGDIRTSGENIVVELIDDRTNTTVTIADVGFGISCILPIIVEGVASAEGSIICVEQPELHLHPRLQAKLADLIIETALKDGKQWIVETHSELIARRIQTRIAERKEVGGSVFLPSDVSALYVDPDPNGSGSKIIEMGMKDTGEWAEESWPNGFFDEGYREVMDVVEARLKRTAEQRMSREKQKEILEKRRARDGSN